VVAVKQVSAELKNSSLASAYSFSLGVDSGSFSTSSRASFAIYIFISTSSAFYYA